MSKASEFILRLYFAVVAAVTLFTLMFGMIDLLSIGLKTYVFTAADVPNYIENCSNQTRVPIGEDFDEVAYAEKCQARVENEQENYQRQKASDAVRNLSLIIISLPLFLLHFRVVWNDWQGTREKDKKKNS